MMTVGCAVDVLMDEGSVFEFVKDIHHFSFFTNKLVHNVFMCQQLIETFCSQAVGNLTAHTAGTVLLRHIEKMSRSLTEEDWTKQDDVRFLVPPMAVELHQALWKFPS